MPRLLFWQSFFGVYLLSGRLLQCLLLGLLQAGLTPNGKTVSGPTLADSTAQANLSSALSMNPQFLTTLWKVFIFLGT